jgi:hypothetical protein
MKQHTFNQEMEDFNVKMFGVQNMDHFVETIKSTPSFKHGGYALIILSLLSDAQEEMVMGNMNEAHQTINRVKYLVDLQDEEGQE